MEKLHHLPTDWTEQIGKLSWNVQIFSDDYRLYLINILCTTSSIIKDYQSRFEKMIAEKEALEIEVNQRRKRRMEE